MSLAPLKNHLRHQHKKKTGGDGVELYKKSGTPLKFFNLLFFAGTLAVNALANILPFNGLTTGEVSDSFRNLFAPAPVTFSIWGLIYLLLGLFVLYQLGWTSAGKRGVSRVTADIGPLFIISCAANMAWIYFWHYQELALTVLFMLVLLVSLIGIYFRLKDTRRERYGMMSILVDLPFSIYLGWISVATIANFSAFFVSIEWDAFGWSPVLWTVVVMVVAVLLGALAIYRNHDYAYALVIVWAFAGIYLQHRDYWAGQYPVIQYAAVAGAAALVVFGIFTVFGIGQRRQGRARTRRY